MMTDFKIPYATSLCMIMNAAFTTKHSFGNRDFVKSKGVQEKESNTSSVWIENSVHRNHCLTSFGKAS